ncbi:MAG: hypothetical protein J0H77_32930 [Alphaproteobacteria bacterium]|nr:hypothetical protein [Alphaproteobacteria bacterium]
MWQTISTWWAALTPPVQGAITSGCFTIVTAAVALFVVRVQLIGQAENAAWNNRHSEALKLKKDIYEKVEPYMLSATKALHELRAFIKTFPHSVRVAKIDKQVPLERLNRLLVLEAELEVQINSLNSAIHRWHIADLRLAIFRVAFAHILGEIQEAAIIYGKAVADLYPKKDETWVAPSEDRKEELGALADKYLAMIEGMDATLQDLENELQNTLLSELFQTKIPKMKKEDGALFPRVHLDTYREAAAFYVDKAMFTEPKVENGQLAKVRHRVKGAFGLPTPGRGQVKDGPQMP